MTPETRRVVPLVVLAAPAAAWGAAAYGLGYWQWFASQPVGSIIEAAQATPHVPVLIAAPALGLAAGIALSGYLAANLQPGFAGAPFRRHLRGTRIVSHAALARKTRSWRRKPQVTVAGVPIPLTAENRGLLLAGAPGTGKTTAFKEIAWGAIRRGDRFIALDPNGDLLRCFWRKGDIILNPHDKRGEGWTFFNEIRTDYDIDTVVRSLVPVSKDLNTEEWREFSRILLAAAIRKMGYTGAQGVAALHRTIALTDQGDLRDYLAGTPGEAVCRGPAKAFQSIQLTLAATLKAHMEMPAGDFSFRRWLDNPDRNIFITWKQAQAASLRPLISAWTDFVCAAMLNMPEDENRRIWLFLDEMAAMDKLASLMALNTMGRKFGLRAVAGIHTIAALETIYGKEETTALLSGFRSMLVLGAAATDTVTPAYFSKALAEHEVERTKASSHSGSAKGGRSSGKGEATAYEREPVIMPSQITGLPDLTGWLRFAGDMPVARVRLRPVNFKQQTEGFEERT